MALLAMDQYGWMLTGLEQRLVPARTQEEILMTLRIGKVPVWLPSVMASAQKEIPASWETTSDSLAAWLVLELEAGYLILVKAVAPPGSEVWVGDLCARGIVDRGFPVYLARRCFTAWWLGATDQDEMVRILEGNEAPRTRIVSA
jgi:5-(aminomethyl)-3-furanmethanol phosphate kinase